MYWMVFHLLLETGIPSKTVGVMSLLFTKTSVNITQSSAVMGNHEHERETKLDYGIRQQACSLCTHVPCGPLQHGGSTFLRFSY